MPNLTNPITFQDFPILTRFFFFLLFSYTFLEASLDFYLAQANERKLHEERYWHLLLHMQNNVSEIDDPYFFLAPEGKTYPKAELEATLRAFYNETSLDDNATACRFPARLAWLKEELSLENLPNVTCQEYDAILDRLSPTSVTLVFPAAHINSPASMFGHTFLRINSSYNSKLLSYAINYAADADPSQENGVLFAVKGLLGGYFGKYSLLPYYDKLKEYRDTENRDMWEYDLDLTKEETLRMVRHIWELNGTSSYYYFFTENCSYNMLWLLEIARPSIRLREHFNFQVIPLETVHAAKSEAIITKNTYRPSKRSVLLAYEKLIEPRYLHMPRAIATKELDVMACVNDGTLPLEQKQYILEAAIEFLEYSFSRNDMEKEEYLALFHTLSKQRAALGRGKPIEVTTPPNPIDSHRAIRSTLGVGAVEGELSTFIGVRPAYHDLHDSNYGFLRGTQIEFLDLLLSHSDAHTRIEKATILSITSATQRSTFIDGFSWRTKFGWDRNSLDTDPLFSATVGGGLSYGNDLGYIYAFIDPLFYFEKEFTSGVGASVGAVIDGFKHANTNIDFTHRIYETGATQNIFNLSQNFRTSQNTQIRLIYNMIEREAKRVKFHEESYKLFFNYYF